MDESMRTLHEAMIVKDRLRTLAELQASYYEELTARGFDGSIAEQLLMDWSRHAYAMTFRAMPEPSLDAQLGDLLAPASPPAHGAQPPRADGASLGDPSSVPPGEPWLQLVQELELEDGEDAASDADDRAA